MTTQIGVPTWFRPHVVLHSAAKMPSSVRAPYRHIAIIKTDGVRVPRMIASVLGAEVVYDIGALHAGGKTGQDAFSRSLAEAVAECRRRNDACEVERMRSIGVPQWRIEQAAGAAR